MSALGTEWTIPRSAVSEQQTFALPPPTTALA
ncbi:CRISPR-associated protein Cas5 [Citrobacter portucalensis]|nr:CRISPR-associated protein Cas5 [Citrobacter portucalensis]MBW7638387.1 CRISPR-associated protein Cas5 [Citrobacter portucalensis]MCA2132800.1 CRISPR-associated protein Cas5 [Citrobacter portucalensis]MCA2142694.1 CRISPR-associated protein Cas5 [Citrobacter portucalensis]MCA2146691.1 CRISPR-associated protein Cas5 [Citrobacter portucalensis]